MIKTDFLPLAPVRLHRTNGLVKGYGLGAPTDAVRGTKLVEAINASAAGEIIEIGPGTFELPSELTINKAITLRGCGRRTVLSRAGAIATITANDVLIDSLRVVGRLNVTGADRVITRNISIDATGQTYGLHFSQEANYYWVTQVEIAGATSHGCYVEQCNEGNITASRFLSNGGDGLRIYDSGGSSVHGTPASPNPWQPPLVSGCNASNNTGHGIALLGVHDTRISGCSGENNGLAGCYIHGPIQNAVLGCIFERNNRNNAAVSAAAGGIAIELYDFAGGAYQGIGATGFGSVIIQGCETAEGIGVRIIGISSATKKDIIVVRGNTFAGFLQGDVTPRRGVYANQIRGDNQLVIEDNTLSSSSTVADAEINNVSGIEVVMNSVGLDSRKLSIRGNNLTGFHRGIILNGHNDTTLEGNKLTNNGEGVYLVDSTPVNIRGGSFDANTLDIVRSSNASDYNTVGVKGLATYDRLLAHWTLDDTPNDSSPNKFHLTLTGSPAYAAGKVKRCIDFDGSDDRANSGQTIIPTTGEYSLAAWINCGAQSSGAASSVRAVIIQGDHGTNNIHIGVLRAGIAEAGMVTARVSGSVQLIGTTVVADSAWHHIVLTRTASASILYVDGVVEASGTAGGLVETGTTQVGGHAFETVRNFDGLIDEPRIYRRALTWYDVQRLKNEYWATDDR